MSEQMFSKEDVKQLIVEVMSGMAAAQTESNKDFAKELAFQLAHPAPTAEEVQRQQNAVRARAEEAAIETEARRRKRTNCTGESQQPHRRPNDIMQGAFAGKSLIFWRTTQYSSRDPETKQLLLGPPVLVGVCRWCGTEWQPGMPDYAEALSWGVDTSVQNADMNIHTGDWVDTVATTTA